jgi:hypothetical protein
MAFRTEKLITRAMMRAHPETLFVFGDNMRGSGRGGQAKTMRDEPNGIGIPTKWFPSMVEGAFFCDRDLPHIRDIFEKRFKTLSDHLAKGGDVVWPEDGIGTGRAQLQERAPSIWNMIEHARQELQRRHP